MRHLVVFAILSGCMGGSPSDDTAPDPAAHSCPMPMAMADTGALSALKAQLCNVSGSMGRSHWYRLSAALPGAPASYVQLELWDGLGAFSGTTVHAGSFAIAGAEADRSTCGVCVRALGDKGGANATEYVATGGSVEVTAIGGDGAPISATLTNLAFIEIDASQRPVTGGCTAAVAGARIDGMVTAIGGTGGGGGGGGGSMCPTTVGD